MFDWLLMKQAAIGYILSGINEACKCDIVFWTKAVVFVQLTTFLLVVILIALSLYRSRDCNNSQMRSRRIFKA